MADYFNRWGTAFPFMGPFLVCCYAVLVGVVIWSAVRHRQQGWQIGLLFGLFLSLPIWGMAAYYLSRLFGWD